METNVPSMTASTNISLEGAAASAGSGSVVVDGQHYICDDGWDLAAAQVRPLHPCTPAPLHHARSSVACWAIPGRKHQLQGASLPSLATPSLPPCPIVGVGRITWPSVDRRRPTTAPRRRWPGWSVQVGPAPHPLLPISL